MAQRKGQKRHGSRGTDRRPGGGKNGIKGRDSGDRTSDTRKPARHTESRQQNDDRPQGEKRHHQADRGDRSNRAEHSGTPWLYGAHAVTAALANPERQLIRLLATAKTAAELEKPRLAPEIVDRDTLDAVLPPGAVHQGIALLAAPLPGRSIDHILAHARAHPRSVVIALDQVTDPQNVGAVMRSAAAFGAAALLVTDRHAPETTGALAKAASGALETVPLIRAGNLVRALTELKDEGFWVAGLDMEAPQTLAEAALPERCVLALGAEGRGLRRLTREHCDLMVRVPMSGDIESLNVSASAAVSLYEWVRQGA